MNKKLKKALIITAIAIGGIAATIVTVAGGFVIYVLASYSRIGDCELEVNKQSSLENVTVGENYKAMTYNIGFGAYSQDYTFFLDTGYDDEGNETCGYYSKAKSKEAVEFNTSGAIQTVGDNNPDFVFFQEVDTNSTRSYHINQDETIMNTFDSYDHVHCSNFHSAFLPYPLYDMHGKVRAGLTTISKYQIVDAERKEYTVADDLSKLFDLDRCFSISRVKTSNPDKDLYIVNSHMSAYDEGGTIRAKQIAEMNAFLTEHKDDYVIVGGDWNHDLLTYNPSFSYNESDNRAFNMTKKTPDWVSFMFDEEGNSPFDENYSIIAADNEPTCRNNDIEWDPNETYVCCVDGFIVSNNIQVNSVENILTKNGNKGLDGFAYSDHQPVLLDFKLL